MKGGSNFGFAKTWAGKQIVASVATTVRQLATIKNLVFSSKEPTAPNDSTTTEYITLYQSVTPTITYDKNKRQLNPTYVIENYIIMYLNFLSIYLNETAHVAVMFPVRISAGSRTG